MTQSGIVLAMIGAGGILTGCLNQESDVVQTTGPETTVAASIYSFLYYYPLDGNGYNVYHGGHSGVLHGPVATTNINNEPNRALKFDGVNDYVSMGRGWDFAGQNGVFTISVWAKATDYVNPTRMIFNYGRGGDRDYAIYATGTNTIVFRFRDGSLSIPGYMNIDDWNHYAMTFDGTTMKIYLNGYLWGQTTKDWTGTKLLSDQPGPLTSNYDLMIGRESKKSRFFWKGSIDDVRLFNYALSPTDIWTLSRDPAEL